MNWSPIPRSTALIIAGSIDIFHSRCIVDVCDKVISASSISTRFLLLISDRTLIFSNIKPNFPKLDHTIKQYHKIRRIQQWIPLSQRDCYSQPNNRFWYNHQHPHSCSDHFNRLGHHYWYWPHWYRPYRYWCCWNRPHWHRAHCY